MMTAGFFISFAGTLTYKSAAGLREQSRAAFRSTDYWSRRTVHTWRPPHRGRRTSPAFVRDTLRVWPTCTGCPLDLCAERVWRNAGACSPAWLRVSAEGQRDDNAVASGNLDATRKWAGEAPARLLRLEQRLAGLAAVDDDVLAPILATVLPGSGKRLRPALALLIGQMGRPEQEALDHMALGVELLHTASLVHDDVVDESDTRRGAATLFTRVGNALAVLVGDYLFSQAAQECVATGDLRVVRLFAHTLGAMAQGQIDEANRQLHGKHTGRPSPRRITTARFRARQRRCSCSPAREQDSWQR